MKKVFIFSTLLMCFSACNPLVWSHFVEGEAQVLENLVVDESKDLEGGFIVPPAK
jgi:hypothetical protein